MVGSTRSRKLVARCRELGWGRMFAQWWAAPYDGEPWGLDNGAFAAWKGGQAFDAESFRARVAHAATLATPPTVAVLPDVVGGGLDSLATSMRWLDELPPMPWYLAVQDGMTEADVAPHLPRLAGLFLGGTDAFKRTARRWCALAHAHGRRFHFARVSTRARLAAAWDMGADSCDSSQPLWSDDHWSRFEGWIGHLRTQTTIAFAGARWPRERGEERRDHE